jgi:hypothetical protein
LQVPSAGGGSVLTPSGEHLEAMVIVSPLLQSMVNEPSLVPVAVATFPAVGDVQM